MRQRGQRQSRVVSVTDHTSARGTAGLAGRAEGARRDRERELAGGADDIAPAAVAFDARALDSPEASGAHGQDGGRAHGKDPPSGRCAMGARQTKGPASGATPARRQSRRADPRVRRVRGKAGPLRFKQGKFSAPALRAGRLVASGPGGRRRSGMGKGAPAIEHNICYPWWFCGGKKTCRRSGARMPSRKPVKTPTEKISSMAGKVIWRLS